MRYTRPLSVCAETRFKPSFLRTTPARKPRTECCCHSVAVMIAAIVAPAGLRSIARMRACLVSDRTDVSGDECADRRGLDLLIVCPAERVETLDFDLDFVMGSSEVMRRHPPHHLSPARAKPGRARPRSQPQPLPSHDSNAPIKPKSQSSLSNIVARLTAIRGCIGPISKLQSRRPLDTGRHAVRESGHGNETDMPKYLGDVRCWVNSGKHLLSFSFSAFDLLCLTTLPID